MSDIKPKSTITISSFVIHANMADTSPFQVLYLFRTYSRPPYFYLVYYSHQTCKCQ